MDKEFIVIIVLLVLIVVAFLAIVVTIAIAAAKAVQIIRPITTVVRGVRRVKQVVQKGLKGDAKKVARNVAKNVKQIATKIKSLVRSDWNAIQQQLRPIVQQTKSQIKSRLPQLIMRGLAILSGDPCAKFDALWTSHISLTFYYGLLSLSNLDPISVEQKAKMDWAANELLQIQQDLSTMMQSCVAENQRSILTQLLKDHILIVAQIASRWREDKGQKGFNSQLVQSWYKNANDTVALLESRTGKQNADLANVYVGHLNQTAAYLLEITKNRGRFLVPTKRTLELFAQALDHAPMLASAFCNQMNACQK